MHSFATPVFGGEQISGEVANVRGSSPPRLPVERKPEAPTNEQKSACDALVIKFDATAEVCVCVWGLAIDLVTFTDLAATEEPRFAGGTATD